jgi:hypothetical protein
MRKRKKGVLPKTTPNLIEMLHFGKSIHNLTDVSIFCSIRKYSFAHLVPLLYLFPVKEASVSQAQL